MRIWIRFERRCRLASGSDHVVPDLQLIDLADEVVAAWKVVADRHRRDRRGDLPGLFHLGHRHPIEVDVHDRSVEGACDACPLAKWDARCREGLRTTGEAAPDDAVLL